MHAAVFLSWWLFGLRHPPMEFVQLYSWVEPYFGAEMGTWGELMPVNIPSAKNSLTIQHWRLGAVTTGAQFWPLAGELRLHKPCGVVNKNREKSKDRQAKMKTNNTNITKQNKGRKKQQRKQQQKKKASKQLTPKPK